MDLSARKRALRAEMAALRRTRPAGAGDAAAATDNLARLSEFSGARALAIYAALPDELSTLALFRRALDAGKRLALPRVLGQGALEFAWVRDFEDLRPGRYGVPEPPSESVLVSLAEMDLIVVPGIAFDRGGGRLGRGGGYYDRALAVLGTPRPFVIGFATSEQLVPEVPREVFDERVDAVVTEAGVMRRDEGEVPSP